jgi:hypothetical protein
MIGNKLRFFELFFTITNAQVKSVDSWTDGKYININGAKLWVVTVGEGDPIIFIAGGPGGVHVGLRALPLLALNHHQLIYFYTSSHPIRQEIYGKVPYGFLYAYNPDNFTKRSSKPYPNPNNTRLY